MADDRVTMSSGDENTSSEFTDTDEELQDGFAKKTLEPGVYALTPFVKKKISVNNESALEKKLDDIKLNLEWAQRLDIVNDLAPVAPELSTFLEMGEKTATNNNRSSAEYDDFKREVLFYRQAQAAVLEAIPRLRTLGIPTKRPDDYFAQMAKSDDHMQKVRETLLNKQVIIERQEKARKLRELRKYGKKIQVETLQKRAKEKKKLQEQVKKLRKGQLKNIDFLNEDSKREQRPSKQQTKKVQQKRKFKDQKYGFGGQKKRSKYNDAKTAADVSDFKSGIRQSKGSKGQKKGGRNKSKGGQRHGTRKR